MSDTSEISIDVYQPRAKHPGGRPTDYQPDFCDLIVQLGEQGASVVQMAYACGVTKHSMYEWAERYQEFSDAFDRARAASQCWWELAGQKGMFMTGFSSGAWSRSMAARFPADWQDRRGVEVSGPGGKPIESRTINATMTAKEASDIFRQEMNE